MKRTTLLLAAGLGLSSALGCGPQFDPSSEVTTLRVMGVQKDKPYAQPGDAVNLQLLWHDPQGRDVQRAFIGGCVNPPGDLYYGCFDSFQRLQASGELPPIGFEDQFTVTLPDDIISGRGGPVEPGQTPYGVYIVFFAVCAGQLDVAMGEASGDAAVPVRCLDDDGAPLGSEDFIVGYSSIYSFQGVSNTNPAFSLERGAGQFLIAGKPVAADCVGSECQGKPPVDVDVECEDEPDRCIASCSDDGEPECPAIEIAPSIVPEVVERDDVSSNLFGSEVAEQQWINYYVDHGSISEVRLLNDSTTGWNAKYRGQLRAPKAAGLLQVWAVSHDNRGGMDFARVTLRVKE